MIELPQANQAEVDILENALHCLSLALPLRLAWHHQFLSFREKDPSEVKFAKQEDCDIYSIHLITQMTRFMIHHHQVSCFPTAKPEAPDRNQAENGPPNWSRKSHLDSVIKGALKERGTMLLMPPTRSRRSFGLVLKITFNM